jgi:hypothetical protein
MAGLRKGKISHKKEQCRPPSKKEKGGKKTDPPFPVGSPIAGLTRGKILYETENNSDHPAKRREEGGKRQTPGFP